MSQNLTAEQWQKLYLKLCTVFNTYSSNQSAQAALYLGELSNCKTASVERAVNFIIRSHDKFPSIAQLLETIHQLDPPPDPVVEASKREAEEWQRAEFERKQIRRSIDNLPEERKFKLIEQAKHDCEKFEGWPAYSIVFNARLIMIYRDKYAY